MRRIDGETVQQTFERARTKLFRYDIFPPTLMRFDLCSASSVTEDLTIVQLVRIAPGIALEAAVRVTEVWNKRDAKPEAGFRYVALRGHPERGWSSFAVRVQGDSVYFEIDVRSTPGTVASRVFHPLSRSFQRSATAAALRYFTHPQPTGGRGCDDPEA